MIYRMQGSKMAVLAAEIGRVSLRRVTQPNRLSSNAA